jgi:hypothetical protein
MIQIIKREVGFFKIEEDNKDHQKKGQILPNIRRQQGSSKEGSSSLKQKKKMIIIIKGVRPI